MEAEEGEGTTHTALKKKTLESKTLIESTAFKPGSAARFKVSHQGRSADLNQSRRSTL